MWFGITYLTREEDGVDEDQVIVSIWDTDRPLRVGGPAESVADIMCALREAGGTETEPPRCDACRHDLGLPDLDARERAA